MSFGSSTRNTMPGTTGGTQTCRTEVMRTNPISVERVAFIAEVVVEDTAERVVTATRARSFIVAHGATRRCVGHSRSAVVVGSGSTKTWEESCSSGLKDAGDGGNGREDEGSIDNRKEGPNNDTWSTGRLFRSETEHSSKKQTII